MSEFRIPPISTLAGTSLSNYLKVLRGNRIDRDHKLKQILTLLIVIIGTPFRFYDRLVYQKKVRSYRFEEDPVFIIGHWRSGTTFLHNLLCQDQVAGYISTYHSVFPNNLASPLIFKNFMKLNMPDKRPSDNVRLSTEYPQEEEFTLGNLHPYSFYNFWYFPENWETYYRKFVRFESLSSDQTETWKNAYKELIIKGLIHTGGKRIIMKNPVNTARISLLLELFPNARFIHIYRNPYIVFLSTFKFFNELFPTLWFRPISEEEIKKLILKVYRYLYQDFNDQKHLVPDSQIIHIRFEEFEKQPLHYLKNIYRQFCMPFNNKLESKLALYLKENKDYRKNTYHFTSEDKNLVDQYWKDQISEFGYSLPIELVVEN